LNVYDVAVVGGGPAGSSAASSCAEAGLKTLLLEKRSVLFWKEKPCSGIVSEETVRLIGIPKGMLRGRIEEVVLISPRNHRYRFLLEPQWLVLDRKRFDLWNLDRAKAAGAEVLTGANVVSLKKGNNGRRTIVLADRRAFSAFVLVLCMGARSTLLDHRIHRWRDNEMLICAQSTIDKAFRFGEDLFCIHFGGKIAPGGYAWLISTGTVSIVGLGVTLTHRKRLIDLFHSFVKRTIKVDKIDLKVQTALIPISLRESYGEGYLITGDCAGMTDPIFGGGLLYAIRSGIYAAKVTNASVRNRDNSEGMMRDYYDFCWTNFCSYLTNRRKLRTSIYKSDQDIEAFVNNTKQFGLFYVS